MNGSFLDAVAGTETPVDGVMLLQNTVQAQSMDGLIGQSQGVC